MRKRIIKFIMVCMLASTFVVFGASKISAGLNISISGVPATVKPGTTFNVTVTIPGALGGTVTLSGNNCTIVSQNPVMIDGSATFTIKAGSQGRATITASSPDATLESDLSITTASGSASFNIASPVTPPSNNRPVTPPSTNVDREPAIDLSLGLPLTISKGKLDPAFASDKLEYTVHLKSDVTKLKVEAKAKDSKATVEGAKEYDVKAGKNEIKVVVSDGKGNSRTYTINAIVEEKVVNSLKLEKEEIGILNNLDAAPILQGFDNYKVKINKMEYNAKKSNLLNVTVVYGVDVDGNKNYYIFDEKEGKITSIYKPLALLGNQYAIISVPSKMQDMAGYKFTDIEIDGQKFNGWVFEDKEFKNYSLIYLMNDKGEKHLYQYESSMNRLQLFSGAAPITQDTYEEQLDNMNQKTMILVGTASVCALIAVISLGSLIVFKKKIKTKKEA